jgi:hypothetical protein
MKSRSNKPKAASAAHAAAHDQEESVDGIIEHIDGEAGDDDEEMMMLDAGSPQPSRATRQTPATRSSLRHPTITPLPFSLSRHCKLAANGAVSL